MNKVGLLSLIFLGLMMSLGECSASSNSFINNNQYEVMISSERSITETGADTLLDDKIALTESNMDNLEKYDEIMSAELPVILVSAGQSGGVLLAESICIRAGIPYDMAFIPTGEQLASGVGLPEYKEYNQEESIRKSIDLVGTPYKTIVFAMGRYTLGMPPTTPEPTFETELERIEDNIEWAEENGVTIIGIHIEGQILRGESGSETEVIIDTILPHCDMILTTATSNYDNKFSDFAHANNIPYKVVDKVLELVPIFQDIFLL